MEMSRRMSRRRRATPATVLVAVVALAALGMSSCSLASYVALGDSYTSGPVIPVQQTNPTGCLRSDHNYPHLVAPNVTASVPVFRDVSCSGAQTKDMFSAQSVEGGSNPPQLDAVDANTRAVSVTIGGNDIGFTDIAKNCASLVNSGTPCQDHYVVNGHDTLAELISATAPKVAAVLEEIHDRAPQAKIFLLGYLDLLPDAGPGCYPQIPITDEDLPYVRQVEKKLNNMLAWMTIGSGNVYVDTYTPSIGKDACKLPTVRWVEPVAPVNPAAPLHPNAAGMQAVATVLLGVMRQNGF